MIAAGADVNATDGSGKSALMSCCARRDTDPLPAIDILIKNGAKKNTQDNIGWCAMHYATTFVEEKRLSKVIPHLIKLGFDPEIKNEKGQSSFDLARERAIKDESEVLNFLENVR